MNETAAAEGNQSDEAIVGGPWLDDESAPAAAGALLFGIGLLMAGNGLQSSLLGIRAEAEGFGLAVTGVVMAGYFAGFLIGPRATERLLSTVGHIRVFAALASVASSAVLMHLVSVTPAMWVVMRFVFGFCMAGSYVVAESWLNDMATNETRGRLLGVYMVMTMGGLAVGQMLLNVADPDGFKLFVVASVLVSASLVPISLSATSTPPLAVPEALSFRELLGKVPTGVFVSFWVGCAQGTIMGLAAVYAAASGLDAGEISLFIAAATTGGLVMQWPIGWISDRVPRRGVMMVTAIAAGGFSLLLTAIDPASPAAVVVMFFLGGTTFPLYSLGIAHTADWVEQRHLNGAAAVLVRTSGIGALVGPLVAGVLMAGVDVDVFFWVVAVPHLVIAGYIAVDLFVEDATPVERQRRFVPFPARASAVVTNLIRRPLRRSASPAAPPPRPAARSGSGS